MYLKFNHNPCTFLVIFSVLVMINTLSRQDHHPSEFSAQSHGLLTSWIGLGIASATPTSDEKTSEKIIIPKTQELVSSKTQVITPTHFMEIKGYFKAPLMYGYKALSKEKLKEVFAKVGVSALGAASRTVPRGQFTPSIVVTEILVPTLNPKTACAESEAAIASQTGLPVTVPSKIVKYGYGETCQIELGKTDRSAIMTIAYSGKRYWMVTCNMGGTQLNKDRLACREFLGGLKPATAK